MRKTNALALAAVLAVFAAAVVQTAAASPEKSASASKLEVTYYYLPT